MAAWYQLTVKLIPTSSPIYTVFSTTSWRNLLENKYEPKQSLFHRDWKVNSKTSFSFLTCCWKSCYDIANHKTNYTITNESCKNIYNKRTSSMRLRNCLHYAKGFELNLGKSKIKKLRPSIFDKYHKTKI